jgi:hypothetical protein
MDLCCGAQFIAKACPEWVQEEKRQADVVALLREMRESQRTDVGDD